MHDSEGDFSRALVAELKKHNLFVQRIETGGTTQGVPDLYIRGNFNELWIELKHSKSASPKKIGWQKGQQAWMYEYYKVSGRCAITVVDTKTCYRAIPMIGIFKDNIVEMDFAVSIYTMFRLVQYIVDIVNG
jgi:Holliday junction resolvase